MNLLKAWNAIAARAKNRPGELRRNRRSMRRALHEPLETRIVFSTRVLPTPFLPGNCTDQCQCSCAEVSTTTDDGALTVAPTPGGLNLTYNSNTAAPNFVLGFATGVGGLGLEDAPVTIASDVAATIGFPTRYFAAPGPNSTDGLNAAFAFQADGAGMATGRYYWIAELTEGDPVGRDQPLFEFQDVVNRGTGEFGSGWWLPELDELHPQSINISDSEYSLLNQDGVLLVTGDNHAIWFKEDPSYDQTDPALTKYTRESGNPYSSATLEMNNSDGSYSLTQLDGSQELFNSSGLLTSRIDPNRRVLRTYAYADESGSGHANKLVSITDDQGRTTDFGYTGSLVTSITDFCHPDGTLSAGSQTTTLYYAGGKLVKITQPNPGTVGAVAPFTTYTYFGHDESVDAGNPAEEGLLNSVTDGRNLPTYLAYDSTLRVSFLQQRCGGQITTASVPSQMLLYAGGIGSSSGNPAPLLIDHELNINIAPLTERRDVYDHVERVTRDFQGKRNGMVTDADPQNSTIYQFDMGTGFFDPGTGFLTSVIQPDPNGGDSRLTTTYTYDSGNLSSVSAPGGLGEAWTYGPFTTTALGSIRVLDAYDDGVHTTTYHHESTYGNVDYTITNGANGTAAEQTFYTYTHGISGVADGLIENVTDSHGRVTHYAYSGDLITSVTQAVGTADQTSTQYQYDARNNVSAVIDGNGHETDYIWNNLDQLVERDDPSPDGVAARPVWKYTYDQNGNRTSVENPLHQVTLYHFDVRDRMDQVTQPSPNGSGAGPITQYLYNCFGDLLRTTDPLLNVVQYHYDGLERLDRVTQPDPDGNALLTNPITTYAYNADGWVTSTTDGNGNTAAYLYDQAGRATSELKLTGAGLQGTYYSSSTQVLARTDSTINFSSDAASPFPGTSLSGDYTIKWDGAIDIADPGTTTFNLQNSDGAILSIDGNLVGAGSEAGSSIQVALAAGWHLFQLEYDHAAGDPNQIVLKYKLASADPASDPVVVPATAFEECVVTTTGYDAASRTTQVTDPMGRTTSYLYNQFDEVTQTTFPSPGPGQSVATSSIYDSLGNKLADIDQLQHVVQYVYDNRDELTQTIQPVADPHATAYSGTVTTTNAALTGTWSGSTAATNGAGATYSFTGLDNTKEYEVLVTWTNNSANLSAYDANALAQVYGDGQLNSANLLHADRINLNFAPDGLDGSQYFTAAGRNLGAYHPKNGALNLKLSDDDNNGLLTVDSVQIVEVGPVTNYAYDLNGQLTSEVDALNSVTTYAYDNDGRRTSVTLPNPTTGTSTGGPKTTYVYDAASNLTSIKDALNHVTSFGYDNDGRRTSVTLPNPTSGLSTGGLTTTYGYDAASNLTRVTDPFGYATNYGYDALNQLHQIVQPNRTGGSSPGPTTTFYRDENGNRTSEVDPKGYTTSYVFDALTRLSSQSEVVALSQNASPVTATTAYTYNTAGDLTEKTDADGRTIVYAYNALDERTAETWFASAADANANQGAGQNPLNTITYGYNPAGALTTAADIYASGTAGAINSAYTFGFDTLGRVTSVDNNDPLSSGTPGVPRVVLNSQYDPNGNRTALSAAITPIGGTASTNDFLNSYTYDRLNRQTQIVQQSNGGYAVAYKKTALGYDAASRLTSLADFKDSATQVVSGSYGYDAVNRLTSLTWFGPGGPFNSAGGYSGGSYGGYFESMSWGFDVDNRVASMTNLDYANENLSYTYDHDSQLINAAASYGGYGGYGGLGGGTYSWDDNGNSTKTGWITGAGNRLLSDGTYSYVYDESGHIVQRSTSTAETDYFWDNRGRLFSVKDYTKSGTTLTQIQQVDYGYDAFNDLISRTSTPYTSGNPSTTGVITTRFVYDLPGGNAVLAFNGNGSMTDRYLWGPAVDQILADERFAPTGSNQMPSTAGTTYWALTDNENTVRDWVTYGSLVDHIIYDSFGKVFSHSNSSVTFAFGHNGVFQDVATGLEYHSQPSTGVPGRWYNPAIQRWMSEDPAGLAVDSNPYRYVRNSPINAVDPSGLIDYWSLHPETPQDQITLDNLPLPNNIKGATPGTIALQFESGKIAENYPAPGGCRETSLDMDDRQRVKHSETLDQGGIWIGKRTDLELISQTPGQQIKVPPDKNGQGGATFIPITSIYQYTEIWDIFINWNVHNTDEYSHKVFHRGDSASCPDRPDHWGIWSSWETDRVERVDTHQLQYLGSVVVSRRQVQTTDDSLFFPQFRMPGW
jgi:RHS repeat-associated protein